MRDCTIKHATEVKFVKDRHTTPATVESSSPLKSNDNTINIAADHCNIFVDMKILDSLVKFITQDGKVFAHPTYFSTGNEQKTISKHNGRSCLIKNK